MADTSSSADTLRILVATDNHLGYAEKDPIRGTDSFNTFEEILIQARDLKVDFILLGGDLFHDNKPSHLTLHSCLTLLRKYCLGDDPVKFEFVSDPNENFDQSKFKTVNYEDPNFNVSIPVFSIHGNHDDPSGGGQLSAMDLLSVSGLVNYFGKCVKVDDIRISPLLLRKGKTNLALYGLGSIRDERLHRAFFADKVKMIRPTEQTNKWFNIFVLHQNRVRHGPTSYIPDNIFDDFLDLVIWGHEHECRIDVEPVKDYLVSQPGSSVATSLCKAESIPKHVALLEVCGTKMRLTKIPLETVRPFYFEDLVLSDTSLDLDSDDVADKVVDYCAEKIKEFIDKAELEHSGNENQPKLPLIRLRVEYKDSREVFSAQRLGQRFVNLVANPKDIVLFQKCRSKMKNEIESEQDKAAQLALRLENLDMSKITAVDLVHKYFEKLDDDKKMSLLPEKMFGEAILEYVDKDEREAINEFIKYQLKKSQNYLKTKNIATETDVDNFLKVYQMERSQSTQNNEMAEVIQAARQKAHENPNDFSDNDLNQTDEESIIEEDESPKTRGRGRARARSRSSRSTASGRGSRSTRASRRASSASTSRARGRGTTPKQSSASSSISSFFGSVDDEAPSKRPRMSQRGVSYFDDDDDDDDDAF